MMRIGERHHQQERAVAIGLRVQEILAFPGDIRCRVQLFGHTGAPCLWRGVPVVWKRILWPTQVIDIRTRGLQPDGLIAGHTIRMIIRDQNLIEPVERPGHAVIWVIGSASRDLSLIGRANPLPFAGFL